MNPFAVRVELRPRSPFEVLDLACVLLRTTWRPMLTLAAVVLPLGGGLSWALGALGEDPWIALPVVLLLAPMLQLPFLLLGGRALFEPEPGVRGVAHDLWTLRGAVVRFGLVVLMAELLLLITVLLVSPAYVLLLFFSEALLLERVDLGRALSRSSRLVTAAAGRAWVGAILLGLGMTWGMAVGELCGQALVRDVLQLGEPFGSAMTGVFTPYALAGLLLSQPLAALYRLLLYVDIRTVTEGWDLQVALRAAAEGR